MKGVISVACLSTTPRLQISCHKTNINLLFIDYGDAGFAVVTAVLLMIQVYCNETLPLGY
jgi:hypothetical protein